MIIINTKTTEGKFSLKIFPCGVKKEYTNADILYK